MTLDAFSTITTATLGHFLTEGFMAPAIQALDRTSRVCGPALTVRLPGADSSALINALEQAKSGDVVVIDRCGDLRHACFGAVMACAAVERGVAGVVIDGFVKDHAAIVEMGLPVWCRGRSPVVTRNAGFSGDFGSLITCGGTKVARGDIILADDSGVAVLDPARTEEVIQSARALQDTETAIIEGLRAGRSLRDVLEGLDTSGGAWHPHRQSRARSRRTP